MPRLFNLKISGKIVGNIEMLIRILPCCGIRPPTFNDGEVQTPMKTKKDRSTEL
jgi:hypothetical protein